MSAADAETQRRIINRLRRARGQLDAVITAIDSGAPCRDVVTQLAAVTHALDRAGFTIVATAMVECVARPDGSDGSDGSDGRGGLTTEELEKLFLMLA